MWEGAPRIFFFLGTQIWPKERVGEKIQKKKISQNIKYEVILYIRGD